MVKPHVDKSAHALIRTAQLGLALGSTALVITLVMSGFYIADTTTGKSNLRNVLATVGLCAPLEDEVPTPAKSAASETAKPGTDGQAGEAGTPGTAGQDGTSGEAGAEGEAGTDGSTGPTGAPGATGSTGSTGPAGPCTNVLDLELINGNLVPAVDNVYSLGSADFRWKGLQIGPGTLYIEDVATGEQVAITVNDGTLLMDGAENLRIGNIRLTSTGLESILSSQDITIGNLGDTGYVVLARGLKFPDGTVQSTAGGAGATGPEGPRGPAGPQGPQGEPGSIGEFKEEKSCVELPREEPTPSERPELMGHILLGTCDQNRVKGTDIVLLLRIP